MKRIIFRSFFLVLFFCLIWAPNSLAQEKRVFIAATGATSGYYAYFAALAKAINEHAPDISPTVIETGGATDNTDRLIRKQVDLALGQNIVSYESYHGRGKWKGKACPEMRVLWVYGATVLSICVREDSGVKSVYDLDGKRFCAGARGSGNEKLLIAVFKLLGIEPEYYRGGYSDAAEAVANNQIVGYSKWSASETTGDSSIVSLALTTDLEFLGFSQEDMKKIGTAFPYVIFGTQKSNCYKGQDYEVHTIGALSIVQSTSWLSKEIGYKICKAAWEGKDTLANAYPACKGINILKMSVERSPIPLHAGTIEFAKELGIKVPQKLIPAD